jgi:hypothetical protein
LYSRSEVWKFWQFSMATPQNVKYVSTTWTWKVLMGEASQPQGHGNYKMVGAVQHPGIENY